MGLTRRQLGETGRKNVNGQKMVEELRKRLGESLEVKTSNSEELRLTYFPARGRAEITRLILAHAGVKFDDIRLTGEDFAKLTVGRETPVSHCFARSSSPPLGVLGMGLASLDFH